ncbi:MAG: hypothetical protein ACOYXT_22610 [Bacteroidota bacterium]
MREQVLSVEEMKATLLQTVGSEHPLLITKKNKEIMSGFVRGFADLNCNILLISEKVDSLAMRIVEIKNISEVVYPSLISRDSASSRVLRARH